MEERIIKDINDLLAQLFRKMKEAGWEWNAEKKELKKISQRMISAEAKEALYDKPTDEEMIEALRTEYEKGRADAIAEMQKEWSEEDKLVVEDIEEAVINYWHGQSQEDLLDWLKSLKERCTWKPCDEQMKALHDLNLTGNISYAGQGQVLIKLYNDLKKLKGE